MKNLARLALSGLIAMSALVTTQASAEVSYNIGFVSEYYYRGIFQKSSSASAGIDFEQNGLYVGAWSADVGDGLEVDLYGGYGIETEAGFSASLGFTGYYYTGDFDDTYQEVNLGLGYGMFSLGYSSGQWDGFGAEEDYDFLEIGFATDSGFYGTYGSFGKDFDGDYFEVGYGTSIGEFDVGVSYILTDELGDQDGDEAEALVFSIGKGF
ncbi:MAG: TorF family putative porin [Pseudomonadales bacterium]